MQPPHNPYEPPRAEPSRSDAQGGSTVALDGYAPLGWRTSVALIGIAVPVPLSLLTTLVVVLGADLTSPTSVLRWLLVAVEGAGSLLHLVGMVVFFMWLYRAASNVRAFGQQTLEFSPGWTVGWWFVPFANLVKPLEAMREIWKASDPASIHREQGTRWVGSPAPTLLVAWWATYVGGNVLSMVLVFATRGLFSNQAGPATIGSLGPAELIPLVLHLVSVLFLIDIMRQIARRQEEAAQVALRGSPF